MHRLFYSSESAEEHSELEKYMGRFQESYVITAEENDMPASVDVRKGFGGCVRIAPMAGNITMVNSPEGSKKGGTLVSLTPVFMKISLEDKLYQVNFDAATTA